MSRSKTFVLCCSFLSTFLISASHYVTDKSKQCQTNAQYNECGTACPRTCTNGHGQWACTAQCVPGCYCVPGYVLDNSGVCVPEEECPKMCSPHSQYNECGTACPRTCRNKHEKFLCTEQCVPGCYCEPGYVLSDNGTCVAEDTCPCFPHSQYNECGTACPRTCANRHEKFFCTAQCVPGCYCEPGYVLNEDGACVAEETCLEPCPPNSQYNECGAPCQRTCKNKDKDIECKEVCKAGCFCEPGYVLEDGNCVPEKTCS